MKKTINTKTQVPKGYKQTEIGIIPEDWEITNLLENSKIKGRIGWQGLTKSEYLTEVGFYLVTRNDLI